MSQGQWAISEDGERFDGSYATREEAIAEAEEYARYVGQKESPAPPETFIDADLVIEHVLCQDEYCHDFAEDTLSATKAQLDELTGDLRAVFGAWIDKHGLRPTFFLIRNPEEISGVTATR